MNPAIRHYRAWRDLLALHNPDLPRNTMQHLGRERGIYVSGHDELDRPIIGFSVMGYRPPRNRNNIPGDVALRADGSFHICWYDNDLKHACSQTFLGWSYVARQRVVFFDPSRFRLYGRPGLGSLNPEDYDNPIPYFRWDAFSWLNMEKRHSIRFHLVPDGDTWRIAIHPESGSYAFACRTLDAEYDHAARRYLRAERRAKRRDNPRWRSEEIDYTSQINHISMLLEPYEPARRMTMRSKEAHHGK